MSRLSVLICHNPIQKWRIPLFERLFHNLELQIKFDYQDHWVDGGRAYLDGDSIDVIWDNRAKISIGEKRNFLISQAVKYQSEPGYVAFVDDDDNVSRRYISLLLEAVQSGMDCASLVGVITEDGLNPRRFEHSKDYNSWFEKNGVFYRPPNHLNLIRTSIASKFKFPTINHGEDKEWSMLISNSGLIKTESKINEVIYFYEYRSRK